MGEKNEKEYEDDELEEEPKGRTIDSVKEKHIICTTVNIPKDILRELGYLAVDEGVSRGEIIRRTLKEYINRKREGEHSSEIPDRELNRLLKACSEDEDSFEIEGEDGFIK